MTHGFGKLWSPIAISILKIKDDFPFVHSTVLYPEWPMAACAGTDPKAAAKIAQTLMSMPKEAPALKAAKIVRWSVPADYTPVTDCLRRIKYGVFGD